MNSVSQVLSCPFLSQFSQGWKCLMSFIQCHAMQIVKNVNFCAPFWVPSSRERERGAGAGPGGVVILWRLMGVGLNPTLVLYKKKNKTSSAIPVTARWPRRVSLPQFPRWENSSSSLGLHFLTPSNFPSGDSY